MKHLNTAVSNNSFEGLFIIIRLPIRIARITLPLSRAISILDLSRAEQSLSAYISLLPNSVSSLLSLFLPLPIIHFRSWKLLLRYTNICPLSYLPRFYFHLDPVFTSIFVFDVETKNKVSTHKRKNSETRIFLFWALLN